MSEVLVDTGPVVAMICAGDRDHAWTVERFRALPPSFLTCEAVIAEASDHIFTLDSDFRVYRRNGRQMIPLITPER